MCAIHKCKQKSTSGKIKYSNKQCLLEWWNKLRQTTALTLRPLNEDNRKDLKLRTGTHDGHSSTPQNAYIWDKICNNLLFLWNHVSFRLMWNRRTALWALFYEIHIMLLATLDGISELELSLCECTEFIERHIRCMGIVQKDPWFFAAVWSFVFQVFARMDSNCQNHQPMNTHNDILSVMMWINEAMKTRRTNTLREMKSAKETVFWTHWPRLSIALNET